MADGKQLSGQGGGLAVPLATPFLSSQEGGTASSSYAGSLSRAGNESPSSASLAEEGADGHSASTSAVSVLPASDGYARGNESSSSLAESISARFERDVKIRDGAEHFLSSATGDNELRDQVLEELMAAHARIAVTYLSQIPFLVTAEPLQEMLHTACALASPSFGKLPFQSSGSERHEERRHLALQLYGHIGYMLSDNTRFAYELPVEDLIATTFPALSESAGTDLRAAAYAILRYALIEPPWQHITAYRLEGLDFYLLRTILRDQRHTVEKEQALKLVRAIMERGSHARSSEGAGIHEAQGLDALVTPAVVRAFASAAEQVEESLRLLYIETLAELSILCPRELLAGGGLRCLLQAAADPKIDIAPELVIIFLSMIDRPETRSVLKPGLDLDSILSGLTDPHSVEEAELASTARVLSMMLRSWTGFLYLCQDDNAALRTILLSLAINADTVQTLILDVFSEFFTSRHSEVLALDEGGPIWSPRYRAIKTQITSSSLSLVESYRVLVAKVLLTCGITDSLVKVIETRPVLIDKALKMMEQLRALTASALPAQGSYQTQAIPDIVLARFRTGGDGRSEQESFEIRERASNVLATLSRYHSKKLCDISPAKTRERSNSSKQVSNSVNSVDDSTFRTLLFEANVLGTKDHTKWSYEALSKLFEGVLRNPRRLEEAMRASKLVRRVLAFYHPFAMRYSTLQNTTTNQRYTRLGCSILTTLLAHPDGVKYIAEDRLLPEIAECLETDIVSERRLEITISGGYFEMIGLLSKSSEGLDLLYDARLFTALFKAMDNSQRTDVARLILRSLDFEQDGHARILLSRVLTHSAHNVRFEGTRRLAEMVKEDSSRWLIRLVINQLYDPAVEIRELAASTLLRECTVSSKTLQLVVSMRPMLEEGAHALLLKFLSTSHGFQYLMQGDYIDREMDEWFHHRNYLYATEVEVLLARAFSTRQRIDDAQLDWDGSLPAHFYGELVKTPEGRRVLTERGHFAEFAHFLRQHSHDTEDSEVLLKLKSVLWAIGNMGASAGGISFLEAENVVRSIVQMANKTQVYSLRGTCFFVLSMIASTQQGADLLADEGWDVAVSRSLRPEDPYGVCMPSREFFALSRWTPWRPSAPLILLPPRHKLERDILAHVCSLGNAIVVAKATRALKQFKERYPRLFIVPAALREYARRSSADTTASLETTVPNGDIAYSTPPSVITDAAPTPTAIELFVRALYYLETHSVRNNIRRFLWELFEARLDITLVHIMQECRARLIAEALHGNQVKATTS